MEAGLGIPRWNDFTLQNDWHLDRVLAAIRSAVQDAGKPEVANALTKAIAKEQDKQRVAARKRQQAEMDAARLQEEEAELLGLEVELRMLRAGNPGMTMLIAVEFVTPDPAHRISLYRRCVGDDPSTTSSGIDQDESCLQVIRSAVAKGLALLQRRAQAEGFLTLKRDKSKSSQIREDGIGEDHWPSPA
jgi:hypothetical protein